MAYQLLLRSHSSGSLAELFARGKCFSFTEESFVLDASQGLPEGVRLEFHEEGSAMRLRNAGGVSVTLGEEELPAGATAVIRHCDRVFLGAKELRFFRLHGRPGVSWAANAVGILAMTGVVLALLVEVAAMIGLPSLLRNSESVHQQKELMELTDKVDTLRKRLKSKEMTDLVAKDPLAATYLAALRDEMERRVRYLRHQGEALTHEERQNHLVNLSRLEDVLNRFSSNPTVMPPLPTIQLDGPVNHLIETK